MSKEKVKRRKGHKITGEEEEEIEAVHQELITGKTKKKKLCTISAKKKK